MQEKTSRPGERTGKYEKTEEEKRENRQQKDITRGKAEIDNNAGARQANRHNDEEGDKAKRIDRNWLTTRQVKVIFLKKTMKMLQPSRRLLFLHIVEEP